MTELERELLEALQVLLAEQPPHEKSPGIDAARAAIAKAERKERGC